MKRNGFFLFILCLFMFTSCSPKDKESDLPLFPSVEEALDYGLQQENSTVLIQEKDGDDILFLIQNPDDALSVASISPHKAGYVWYRSIPYFGFSGTMTLDCETISSRSIPIVFGNNAPAGTTRVVLSTTNGQSKELPVTNGYYLGLNMPKATYTVTPVE